MTEKPAATDGKFELFYRKGWACLTVLPPAGSGRPVYTEEIESRMKILKMPRVSTRVLREIIEAGAGEPVPLVEWPEGDFLAPVIRVEVAEDGMTAAAVVEAPKKGGAPPLPEDVEAALRRSGVVFGIDRQAVASFAAPAGFGRNVVVARGTAPVHGEGARIGWYFNVNRGKPYLEMDFGRIDLKELNFIDNKNEGDLLAELLPPVRAVDGRSVTGSSISARPAGEGARLNAGPNTKSSADRMQVYAARDGNAKVSRSYVIIEPVVTVENVNYETGNIHFEGSVVIKGSVADGFTVEAGGDIQVGKSVGRAFLKAGGNILLRTGINGSGEGELDCGGNLFAKYIESCRVVCRGNLFVEEAVMHSHVTVWKNCVLSGRRSEFIAGSALVGGSFWCKKIGNIYDAPTHVSVGTHPNLLLSYRSAQKALDGKLEELNRTEEKLAQFEKALHEGRGGDRTGTARDQLRAAANTLSVETAVLRRRLPSLREELRPAKTAILVAEDIIYRGVTIVFGNLEFRVPDNGARKTVLKAADHEIVESGYNYREKPVLVFDESE